MDILGLQIDIAWQDCETNTGRVRTMLAEARPAPGTLVVLPEVFASGFSMDVAASTAGAAATESVLAGLARQYRSTLVAGLAVPAAGGCGANEAVVFGPDGRVLVRYRKMQPFTLGGERESYPAGNDIVTFGWGPFTVAPFICYDLRFPELFRAAADRGADLFVVVASWPSRRHHHWSLLLRARAIENQAFTVGVNRAGADPNFNYAGGSAILGPQAEVLAEAADAPCFIRAAVTHSTVEDWRAQFPALRDRRPEFKLPRP